MLISFEAISTNNKKECTMKLIGVECYICGATVLDNGTKCVRCGNPYSPEVIQMGAEHKQAVQELLKKDVQPDAAVEILATASSTATPTVKSKGSGLLGTIRYWLNEFHCA